MIPIYDRKDFRREILKTLDTLRFCEFRIQAVLKALRASGFEAVTSGDLLNEVRYLEKKGLLNIKKSINPVTEEEFMELSINEKGVDLLEGNCSDVGVSCG